MSVNSPGHATNQSQNAPQSTASDLNSLVTDNEALSDACHVLERDIKSIQSAIVTQQRSVEHVKELRNQADALSSQLDDTGRELKEMKGHAKRLKSEFLAEREFITTRAVLEQRVRDLSANVEAGRAARAELAAARLALESAEKQADGGKLDVNALGQRLTELLTAISAARIAAQAENEDEPSTDDATPRLQQERDSLVARVRELECAFADYTEAASEAAAARDLRDTAAVAARELADQEVFLLEEQVQVARARAEGAEQRAAEQAGRVAAARTRCAPEATSADNRSVPELQREAASLRREIIEVQDSFRRQLVFMAKHKN